MNFSFQQFNAENYDLCRQRQFSCSNFHFKSLFLWYSRAVTGQYSFFLASRPFPLNLYPFYGWRWASFYSTVDRFLVSTRCPYSCHVLQWSDSGATEIMTLFFPLCFPTGLRRSIDGLHSVSFNEKYLRVSLVSLAALGIDRIIEAWTTPVLHSCTRVLQKAHSK